MLICNISEEQTKKLHDISGNWGVPTLYVGAEKLYSMGKNKSHPVKICITTSTNAKITSMWISSMRE